jgi:hypothetical protein
MPQESSVSSPVSFAKGLSDSFQHTRLNTMKELNTWMVSNGASYEFTSVELDQLWRALQYSFWMADKRPVQQQFAAEAVMMIRQINKEYMVEWNRAFWFNIERIYETVDKFRIPKFHLLLRIYLAELFHQIEQDPSLATPLISGFTNNIHKSNGAYMHIVSILVDELKYDSEKSLTDLVLSESTFVAILEIAFNVIRNSIRFPISLSGKVCECILTRPEVIQYSDSVREMIRSLIQSTAMDKKTDQEVRDILYGSIDQIDAIPAIVRVEKKRKSLDKQGTTKKTKKM